MWLPLVVEVCRACWKDTDDPGEDREVTGGGGRKTSQGKEGGIEGEKGHPDITMTSSNNGVALLVGM